MIKYIETGTEFYDTGEQTITPLVPYHVSEGYLTKQASEISDYIRNLKADVDSLYLHINALGSSDHWGMNANGDVFPESQLLTAHKTFEEYGNFYKHHMNKPHMGHKVYGKVLYAYYNPSMHRVELIAKVVKDLAPDIVEEIADGKDVAVSMAIKVPYDICTIKECGNRAKRREDYCSHGKTMLTKVLEDGQQVGRINPPGRFFDISKVFRPADRTGYVLRKVASRGYVVPSVELADIYGISDPWPEPNKSVNIIVKSADDQEKLAQVAKLAEIEKHIEGVISSKDNQDQPVIKAIKMLKASQEISDPDMEVLKKCDFEKVLSRMLSSTIVPEFSEVQRLLGKRPEGSVAGGFQYLQRHPEVVIKAMPSVQSMLLQRYAQPAGVEEILERYAPFRSGPLQGRLVCISFEKCASRAAYVSPVKSGFKDLGDKGVGALYCLLKMAALPRASSDLECFIGKEYFSLETPSN